MNTLRARIMGCAYKESDIPSYRVRVEFNSNDGKHVTADCSQWNIPEYDAKGRIHWTKESFIHPDWQYKDEKGFWWSFFPLLRKAIEYHRYPFTIKGMLDFVNKYSAIQYDNVEFYD